MKVRNKTLVFDNKTFTSPEVGFESVMLWYKNNFSGRLNYLTLILESTEFDYTITCIYFISEKTQDIFKPEGKVYIKSPEGVEKIFQEIELDRSILELDRLSPNTVFSISRSSLSEVLEYTLIKLERS